MRIGGHQERRVVAAHEGAHVVEMVVEALTAVVLPNGLERLLDMLMIKQFRQAEDEGEIRADQLVDYNIPPEKKQVTKIRFFKKNT